MTFPETYASSAGEAVERLFQTFGTRRTLVAILRHVFAGRPARRSLADLPDALRRDIGLPELPPAARFILPPRL